MVGWQMGSVATCTQLHLRCRMVIGSALLSKQVRRLLSRRSVRLRRHAQRRRRPNNARRVHHGSGTRAQASLGCRLIVHATHAVHIQRVNGVSRGACAGYRGVSRGATHPGLSGAARASYAASYTPSSARQLLASDITLGIASARSMPRRCGTSTPPKTPRPYVLAPLARRRRSA